METKKADLHKIVCNTETEQRMNKCFFSDNPDAPTEFETRPGETVFLYNGNPVSPQIARKRGFVASVDLSPPSSVNTRAKLGVWLRKEIGLNSNEGEFLRLYKLYGAGLEAGHERDY